MATAKKTTVKRTAAPRGQQRSTAKAPAVRAKPTPPQESEAPSAGRDDALWTAATQLALDFLYKEAFKYGRRPHAARYVQDASIPQEVKVVLLGVIERNES